jgi:3-hydroxyisobutyrate dehydrogenase-like beta-hydroxyacid dehydrogenase
MKQGAIVVDCSTINYMAALSIGTVVEDHGVAFMDAPVSGMQSKAEDGTLTIMCGGEAKVFDAVKQLLDFMGTNVLYMGKIGNGQLSKMINNSLYDINCVAMSEMLAMAVKLGLEPQKIGTVINGGTGRSYASEYFVPKILERDFSYGFTLKSAYKDLVSAVEAAAHNGIPTPVLDAATSVYKMTMLSGYEELYKGALIRVYEDMMGIRFEA